LEAARGAVFDRCMRLAAIVIAVLVLASCGGKSESDRARSAVEGWLATLSVGSSHGDSAKACSYLTRGLQTSMNLQLRTSGLHATCKTYAANWTGRSEPPGNRGAHVTKVVVEGTKARAELAAPPDRTSEVTLRKVRDRWLIENY
jgi:hypothetical protein